MLFSLFLLSNLLVLLRGDFRFTHPTHALATRSCESLTLFGDEVAHKLNAGIIS
jgi:hypothetical protein